MTKKMKLLSVFLCVVLLTVSLAVPSNASVTSALTGTKESRVAFGNRISEIIQSVVKGICKVYPAPRSWQSIDEYDSTYVYDKDDGRADYLTTPADGAAWQVGYASGSIIPDDFAPGKYTIGRMLNFASGGKAKAVLDDQRVRVVCLDDGSGQGAIVFAVIDGLGVTSNTIRTIRESCADYTKDGRIAAINISATHTHSALDTQGVSAPFLPVFLKNVVTNLLGTERAGIDNDPFIENLINVTTAKIKEAYAGMEPGRLYYDVADSSAMALDKRGYIDPENLADAGILRFEPTNPDSKGTYLVNYTCHPTRISAGAGLVSSDYVFYTDYAMQKAGYNFVMTQGAVGQVSSSGIEIRSPERYLAATNDLKLKEKVGEELYDDSNCRSADTYGEALAELLLNAKSDERAEEELSPVLNAKYAYVQFTADNYTLHLACRCRLVDNPVYKTGKGFNDVVLPSEVGYVEFGGRVAFGLYPCELYPEVFGGKEMITNDVENYSWDGSDWSIKSAQDMVKDGIDVYAVSFANDYIGYVVPDNFYSGWGHWALKGSDRANYEYDPNASIFDYAFGGTADQLLSAGKHCASSIMTVFQLIADSTK